MIVVLLVFYIKREENHVPSIWAIYLSNKDIVKGSGYITKQCCGSNEIELGTVYAAELGITLFSDIDLYTLDDALVHLYYHLQLDDE